MAVEYFSFDKVLRELNMDEDELKRLVSEGQIRAFRDEDKMKFRREDIDSLKRGRMTEPTIVLPGGDGDDVPADEDTAETLLDLEGIGAEEEEEPTSIPTVDFSTGPEIQSDTRTEELDFSEDDDFGGFVDDSELEATQQIQPSAGRAGGGGEEPVGTAPGAGRVASFQRVSASSGGGLFTALSAVAAIFLVLAFICGAGAISGEAKSGVAGFLGKQFENLHDRHYWPVDEDKNYGKEKLDIFFAKESGE